MTMKIAFVSALAGLTILAAPAWSQQAPPPATDQTAPAPKAKAKKKVVAKNASTLILVNNRGAAVTGLQVTSAAGKNVAKLKSALEPGKKITLTLAKGAGCAFAINAAFSDDAELEQTQVDLCADKTVRFTD